MAQKQQRRTVLERQGARLQRRLDELKGASSRLSWARLLAFFSGIVVVFFAFSVGEAAIWVSAIAALAIFGALVMAHQRIERGITRHRLLLDIVETHLARMRLDWVSLPPVLDNLFQPNHPYEIDIDITGERSLHHLLDCATTREGSERLRDWLLYPLTDRTAILDRQALAQELIPLTAFRDKTTVSGQVARRRGPRRWSVARLQAWAALPPETNSLKRILLVLVALAVIDAVLFLLNQNGLLPALWIVPFVVYLALTGMRYSESSMLFDEALKLQEALEQATAVFRHLETFGYSSSPRLKALCSVFLTTRPSAALRRVRRIVSAAGLQHNVILWGMINAVVPWDVFFAHQLRKERAALSAHLPRWIDVWLELEALISLANFAYLNPETTFPQIADVPMSFSARQLGHPLIPDGQRVCNDFAIEQMGDAAIITGSNMSGKSSFLRTLGVNLCLAYAGAPAVAEAFEVSVFRLFTCIRVTDSLADGISYFYAEVRRLKALLLALEDENPLPLFFLIDEIFRGTNNRERLIGSRAYIRALIGKHGVGVISTHDLELVRLADELPQITNYHFEDRVTDDRMVFDYVLREGPSPTTNALKIMEQVGLPVAE
jgi:hypothetical protein